MKMSMSQNLGMTQRIEQRIHLTMEARAEMILTGKLALLQILTLTTYNPVGVCPKCNYKLSKMEILKGFNRDPNDYTTLCVRCKHRFEPRLITYGRTGGAELPFYCLFQAVEQLRRIGNSVSPDVISKDHPAVYHSLIVHCGTIKAAFERIGFPYPFKERFKEKEDWKEKILPFLGQMPDAVIADCTGLSSSTIGRVRKREKIPSFTERN